MANTINPATIALVKSFEGFRANPYQDVVGVWTQGYGETQDITEDTPPTTEEAATEMLIYRLSGFGAQILEAIKTPLNDNQFGALVSLCYNCGSAPLVGTLGNRLNANDYEAAADEFPRWNHAGGEVSDGLTRRRLAEQKLFNTPASWNNRA